MNEDSVDFNQNIRDLEELGITVVPDVISKSTCEEFIGRCEALCDMYIREGRRLNAEGQFINSPFRFDDRFLSLLEIPVLFPILSQVLDPDFVVINSNIINNRLRQDIVSTGDKIGGTWHTDSRYLGGRRLDRGFGYIAAILFNDFDESNGATKYVPRSHLFRDRPERESDYEYEYMVGSAGDLLIFDCGMWHRAGDPSEKNRWGLFSFYGPWFMKPYFAFPEMLGTERGKGLSKRLRHLLHYIYSPGQ